MENASAKYEVKRGVLYICPKGDIDHEKTVKLRECADRMIDEWKVNSIVLDFREVDFIDSAGIGFVMGRYRKICHSGGRIKAVNVGPYVGRILKYSGLHQIMEIEDKEG
ncbi:MAG: anti-sigma factor antagonist [Clostridiales bacterium]|nr:anti-sigma factor antagonist [Clostridiales bacterium]